MAAISNELSVPDAARRLGVSERTIWNWIEAQRLNVSREAHFGKQRRVWVTAASVEAEQRRREGETEGA